MGPKVLLQAKSNYKLQSKKNSKGLSSLPYYLLVIILKHAKKKQDPAKTLKGANYVKDARKLQRMR